MLLAARPLVRLSPEPLVEAVGEAKPPSMVVQKGVALRAHAPVLRFPDALSVLPEIVILRTDTANARLQQLRDLDGHQVVGLGEGLPRLRAAAVVA